MYTAIYLYNVRRSVCVCLAIQIVSLRAINLILFALSLVWVRGGTDDIHFDQLSIYRFFKIDKFDKFGKNR